MKRVRWVLFIAAAVFLLGGVVMQTLAASAARKAAGMITDAVAEAQAEAVAFVESATKEVAALRADSERTMRGWSPTEKIPDAEIMNMLGLVKIQAALTEKQERLSAATVTLEVLQSAEFVAVVRRHTLAETQRRVGYYVGGSLGVLWFVLIIPLLPRFVSIAYHKSAVATVRGAVRSKQAVRKHVRGIVDEATEDE